MQRERAGEFNVEVGAPHGMRISSPVARFAALKPRLRSVPPTSVKTYIRGLDAILADDAVCEGDRLALDGISGSARTLVGAMFLLGAENPAQTPAKSLFVSDFSRARMRELLELVQCPGQPHQKDLDQVEPLPIERAMAHPAAKITRPKVLRF